MCIGQMDCVATPMPCTLQWYRRNLVHLLTFLILISVTYVIPVFCTATENYVDLELTTT